MPSDADVITFLRKELESSRSMIHFLERENQELKQEVTRLKDQVNTLKAHDVERKNILWKKLQNSMNTTNVSDVCTAKKPVFPAFEKLKNEEDLLVQMPPPRPPIPSQTEAYGNKAVQSPPAATPPPPPPPPLKSQGGSKGVRRVPEVMEFYRSLMKKDVQKESKSSVIGSLQDTNPRNMIGEIENRSTYLLSIKSDVETHEEFIKFLSREVEKSAFTEISEVESFVKWLDGELSCLVDERAVLKHFPQWPERKADALREAACSYRELKNLETEVSSFKDNTKQLLTQSLRKMQLLQDRLERSTSNIERVRDGASKRYREFHIPWEWMLDKGVIGRLKLSSLLLAKQLMERITKELQCSEPTQEEDLLLQGVRFAYRVHQFAGGFDPETTRAFEELKKKASRYRKL